MMQLPQFGNNSSLNADCNPNNTGNNNNFGGYTPTVGIEVDDVGIGFDTFSIGGSVREVMMIVVYQIVFLQKKFINHLVLVVKICLIHQVKHY